MLGFLMDHRICHIGHEKTMLFRRWVCIENMKSFIFVLFILGYVTDDYVKSMPDILVIGFQEICDLTAANMVWQRYGFCLCF